MRDDGRSVQGLRPAGYFRRPAYLRSVLATFERVERVVELVVAHRAFT